MKKIISIFIVLIIFFDSAGYIIIFLHLKSSLKKETCNKFEEFDMQDELNTIIMTKYEFENQNENFYFIEPQEIFYHGNIYDITKLEFEEDKVKITALNDETEKKLINLFLHFYSYTFTVSTSDMDSELISLIDDASLPNRSDCLSPVKKDVCSYFINIRVLNNNLDILTPPPKYPDGSFVFQT